MSHPTTKTQPQPVQPKSRAIPAFIATDLLERLIADRDARAVDRMVTAARRQ